MSEEKKVKTKKISESKTMWFNAVVAIVAIFSSSFAELLTQNQATILLVVCAAINLYLRYFQTETKLTVK